MNLKIVDIHNRGDHNQECVELYVLSDCNLSDYAIYDTTFSADNYVSNKSPHFFRFPDYDAKAGQTIRLHTGKEYFNTGISLRKLLNLPNADFYWNLDHAIWNNTGDTGYLIQIADTQSYRVGYNQISRLLDSLLQR